MQKIKFAKNKVFIHFNSNKIIRIFIGIANNEITLYLHALYNSGVQKWQGKDANLKKVEKNNIIIIM